MRSANVVWSPPLTRLLPFYPGQMGVPGSDNKLGLRLDATGSVFYVDPNHPDANANADGTNPNQPLSTVAAALLKCTDYNNDVIVVSSNADWTYGDTSVDYATPVQEAVTVNVAGVRIIGLAPSGSLGVPWIPTDDDAVCITVNAMDVLIEGFNFWDGGSHTGNTAILAQWNSPTLYGENLTVRNCYFYSLSYGVVLDYAWNCAIEGCKFDSCDPQAIHNRSTYGDVAHLMVRDCEFQNCASAINLPDSDSNIIEHCRFMDNTLGITMGVTASDNIVHSNVIMGTAAGTNNFINLSGGAGVLNIVSDNWLGCTIAQYDTTCSPGGGGTDAWVGNHLIDGNSTANPT